MTVSINLPVSTFIRNIGGEALSVDWAKVPDSILPQLVVAGAKVILTNTYNGGGKEASEADKAAALQKKLDAWYRGEFNVVTRGDSQMTALRNQYIDERRAATKQTQAQVEATIKATVKQVFGADESATFAKFLDAVATMKSKAQGGDFGKLREELESGLAERTAKAEQARAEAAAALTIDPTDLGF